MFYFYNYCYHSSSSSSSSSCYYFHPLSYLLEVRLSNLGALLRLRLASGRLLDVLADGEFAGALAHFGDVSARETLGALREPEK